MEFCGGFVLMRRLGITPSVFGIALVAAASVYPAKMSADEPKSFLIHGDRQVGILDMFQECAECPEMIVVPTGTFMMGATPEESRNPFDFFGENATLTRRAPDDIHIIPHEHPRHKVVMDLPFAMGRNEITHAQWMQCVDAGGCSHSPDHRIPRLNGYKPIGPDHPVINVSFQDVQEYLAWLNGLVGDDVYRLPTEAEWEYSAKAGAQTRYAQGEEVTSEQANFSGDATETILGVERPDLENLDTTVRVWELDAANGWGLRHMSGNVEELTQSCWTDRHLELTSATEYFSVDQDDESCQMVLKGGSFTKSMDGLRPAARGRAKQSRRVNRRGFRVVRSLK